jgi:hypothetical protein
MRRDSACGVFALYTHAITPGLHRTDDRSSSVRSSRSTRRSPSPLFLATFIGVLVIAGVAAALHLRGDPRSVLLWIAAAFVLFRAVFASSPSA